MLLEEDLKTKAVRIRQVPFNLQLTIVDFVEGKGGFRRAIKRTGVCRPRRKSAVCHIYWPVPLDHLEAESYLDISWEIPSSLYRYRWCRI